MFALGTVLVLGAPGLQGCDPPSPTDPDGGISDLDGGGDGVSGRVEVRIEAHATDSETSLESGTLEIERIRARSDRGEPEEPRWDDVGAWDFDRDERFEAPGLPATYGGVRIEWSSAECQVYLRLSHSDSAELEICLSGLPPLDLRCESPVELMAGASVQIDAQLELGDIDGVIADGDVEDGDRIDATSNPELHTALVAAWPAAWSARCESGSPGDES